METIGNLPQGAARAFLAGLLKRQPAPVDLAKDWPEIYMVCGGNLGLLKHCLQGAASYQSLDPGNRNLVPLHCTDCTVAGHDQQSCQKGTSCAMEHGVACRDVTGIDEC